ncbi:LuxR C-terminal-related transcriptional regulator [Streptomyces sp. NPDC048277]|uniref:ATP-binding protein n=1 Tax=Streptomyces sp. NPDC048277 TaxID=3155027 RepID=UPI0033F6ED16
MTTAGGVSAELTTLVGRRAEIARIGRLLSTARLVTLTGVGGVGKTRLALRVARDAGRSFPDGVHLVELAGLREADLLAQSVGTVLGLANPGRERADATQALAVHLRDRRALLVLDNCEHLVDACARLADTLLRAAPGLCVLATGRQALGVTAEHVFPVEPLPVVDPERLRRHAGGWYPDGWYSDGQHLDGRQTEARHLDGRYPDGRHPDGRQTGGQHPDTRHLDGRYPDVTQTDVRQTGARHTGPRHPTARPARGRSPLAELLGSPAVVLFAERAAAVRPGFTVTEGNAETVARIVHRLDGLPFAIELAAARLRTLTPEEILDRLTDRFALLTTGSRTAVPRQRTLRELIDWSHALCGAEERALWARASVFRGGFDLEGAERVCADGELPAAAILDVLDGLVEKSVLVHRQHDGRSRYQMLETVREYGRERLAESGELAVLRRRHRDHYLGLTARAEDEWFGSRQVEWFARLRADHTNVRAALEYCLEQPGETAAGLALAVAPRHYWITAGSLAEGRRWLGRLLAAPDAGTAPLRALALGSHAYLGILQGQVDGATLAALDESARLAERHGDVRAASWTRHHRAVLATWQEDYAHAAELFEEAATAFRAAGRLDAAVECTVKLAMVHAHAGDAGLAARLYRELAEVTEAHGESWLRGMALFAGSLLAWRSGDARQAAVLARRAIRLMHPFQDWWDIAMCAEVLAWGSVDEPRHAARLLGVLHLLWESIGGSLGVAPFMRHEHRRFEERVRAALTPADFDRAFRRGADATVAEALAYVLDESPPATGERGPGSGPPLTRREWQVADLVAEGLTNKQIAARLVIAQRTAENHVERILTKLGFSSRSQLAVWTYGRTRDGTTRTE